MLIRKAHDSIKIFKDFDGIRGYLSSTILLCRMKNGAGFKQNLAQF